MKILAVDTSSLVAGVAVIEDTKLLAEFNLNHKKTHSQKLMPIIGEVLESLELKPHDIDFFAASTGPGSFTGLRIGITTIKAIAYTADKPVISVPTLDALAYNLPESLNLVCPIMDARNRQVFTAVYKWEDRELEKASEYLGIGIDELVRMIGDMRQKAVFLGDGVEVHREFLKAELGDACSFAPDNSILQRASSVAFLARAMALRGEIESSFEMLPFYLRKSQAEREYEKKCGQC